MISTRRHLEALREADMQAVVMSRADIDRRLEAMNELGKQIEKGHGSCLNVDIYEAGHQALGNLIVVNGDRIAATEKVLASLQARLPAIGALITLLSAGMGALVVHVLGG